MNVLYRDADMIFVNKPAGIVVQRGYDADEPVLVEEVAKFVAPEHAFLMQRLDRGTSGVIFFSLKSDVNPRLTRMFERKEIHKEYIALVEGRLESRETVDAPLVRIGPISFGVRTTGKKAVTGIEPLVVGGTATLVRVHLMTGRTHQIRVHLAAIGHPLVGDWLYGQRNDTRPMLHARSLRMPHPRTREELFVEAELPPDFLDAMERRGLPVPTDDRSAPPPLDGMNTF